MILKSSISVLFYSHKTVRRTISQCVALYNCEAISLAERRIKLRECPQDTHAFLSAFSDKFKSSTGQPAAASYTYGKENYHKNVDNHIDEIFGLYAAVENKKRHKAGAVKKIQAESRDKPLAVFCRKDGKSKIYYYITNNQHIRK